MEDARRPAAEYEQERKAKRKAGHDGRRAGVPDDLIPPLIPARLAPVHLSEIQPLLSAREPDGSDLPAAPRPGSFAWSRSETTPWDLTVETQLAFATYAEDAVLEGIEINSDVDTLYSELTDRLSYETPNGFQVRTRHAVGWSTEATEAWEIDNTRVQTNDVD